jgi:beta-lactam-binding protein with PASTA domain
MQIRLRPMVVALMVAVGLAASGCSEDLGGAPNVKGLTLDVAQQQLKTAGFGVSAKDDSMFGVVIAAHFTVCEQHTPSGKLVPLDVSKQC